jgi:hypothetical protein
VFKSATLRVSSLLQLGQALFDSRDDLIGHPGYLSPKSDNTSKPRCPTQGKEIGRGWIHSREEIAWEERQRFLPTPMLAVFVDEGEIGLHTLASQNLTDLTLHSRFGV